MVAATVAVLGVVAEEAPVEAVVVLAAASAATGPEVVVLAKAEAVIAGEETTLAVREGRRGQTSERCVKRQGRTHTINSVENNFRR